MRNKFTKTARAVNSGLFIDLHNKFKAHHSNHICFIEIDDDEHKDYLAWKESQKEETPPAQKPPEQTPPAPSTPPKESKTPLSPYEQAQEDKRKKEEQKNERNKLEQEIRFEQNFDSLIKKNESYFSMTSEQIRTAAKGLTGESLNHTLACTAAKAFFDQQDNLDLLPESDLNFIKSHVLGQHDNNIDSSKVWPLVESALHIKGRLSKHSAFRSNGDQATDVKDNAVTDYIARVQARGEGKKIEKKGK